MRKSWRTWAWMATFVVAPAAAAPTDEVLATDRAFSAAAQSRGTREAFLAFAAPDAILFRPRVGPVRGRAAIDAAMSADPPATLVWEPEAAEVAASGDLAYTWGYYRYTLNDEPAQVHTGNYVSVWRRIDGRWRWVIDLGVPAPAKAR